ncbi:MAG: DNA-directed RNA polymerase subunit G [Desulfurococcaceae archaeon]|nr:DNA-directed RNA polymerase subunit G [Desulfurococcaceae archaeon]MCC6052725.1 DNA-directed RNA polymerase subunit G [Desulfurococcaceae archaeon]
MEIECSIKEITPLRVPRIYRVRGVCREGVDEVEVEFHEDVVKRPSPGAELVLSITSDKETCLNYYFCAHGYVLSNTPIGEINRVIVSLHGLLVVLKSKKPLDYKSMDHVYVGANIK